MSDTITFSIRDIETGKTIQPDDLIKRYKIYCREVSHIDLEAQGGFALGGDLIRTSYAPGDVIAARVSGEFPFLICIDKRGPNAERGAPAIARWAYLMMPSKLMNRDIGTVEWGEHTVHRELAFSMLINSIAISWFPFASYTEKSRKVLASGYEDIIGGVFIHPNPYYTIAKDLDYLSLNKYINGGFKPVEAIPGLGKSLDTKHSVHERFWVPGHRKFLGEIGGIVLLQNIRNHTSQQPEFLAEALIAELDNIPEGELDSLLELTKDQGNRFRGMQEEFKILEQLLEAKMKKSNPDKQKGQVWYTAIP